MATNTRKSGHLDKIEVRNRLQDPHALLAALGLLPNGAGRKKSYMIPCLWCGGRLLSIWNGRDSVIGTCKGDCKEGGRNKTYSPLDIIAKVKGWAMSGEDFNLKVLPLADQIGRGVPPEPRAPTKTAQNEPQAGRNAPQAPEPSQAAPRAAEAQPGAAQADPQEQDHPDPCRIFLHPDLTREEWRCLADLEVDPHAVRRLGWWVLQDRKGQPPELLPHIQNGYALWRESFDAVGNYGGWCGLLTSDASRDPWLSIPDDEDVSTVIANEFGERLLERGPSDLAAWPEADQNHPTLYLAADPIDFLRAEAAVQQRLEPLIGLLDAALPADVAERFPPSCRRVLLHAGPATAQLRKLAAACGAALLHLGRLTPSALSVEDLDSALAAS